MITNGKKNILQLVNGVGVGGAELKLLELVKYLNEKYPNKYKQIVCSVGQGGALKNEFERLGVKVFVFPKLHKFDVVLIFKVAWLMRKEKIDIVQTTLLYADVIGALAAKLANVKIVFSWETASHTNNVFHGSIQRRVGYRLAMKFVNKIIAVSGEVKKSLIEWRRINPSKIKVVHYGVDISKFNKFNKTLKKKEIGVDGNFPILGVVSRLQLEKGHVFLLQALVEVVKKFPNTKCIFVGSGIYRKKLEKKVQMLRLEKNVLFLGFRDDIADLLVIMDIFILPSLSEGMPNAVLEAMACSLPVVASSVGGIPEAIINNQTFEYQFTIS